MSESTASALHQIAINTIRFLAVDMVEQANSGHPGAPMAQAPMAYWLWSRHLRHHPGEPRWPDRDRFVLSCGHASALLYSLLHMSGYDLSLDDLRSFRQLGSPTPGHPERRHALGVETTTGPLGQGLGNAVGMAIAQRMLAARFNREGFPLFTHRVWVLASDGDLMEGVTSEACSLAGHLRLGRLIVFYDDNRISIDGPTDLTFTEDVCRRYQAYGWQTIEVADGNDLEALEAAIEEAKREEDRPSLVRVRTHIAYGSPNKQDTAASHGAPLGPEEVRLTKEALGWPTDPAFLIPEEARTAFEPARERGRRLEEAWRALRESYRRSHPEEAEELERRLAGELAADWDRLLPDFRPDNGPLATRKASGRVLNSVAERLPELVGGSADLAGSNNTFLDGERAFAADSPEGRNLHFGVREHAMGAILNGVALSGMLRPFGGTFLVFSDYMRPSIRLAAMMGLPVTYVFTHDSILLGEDGPTHQPVSQLLSLRAIPGLTVIRPADACETAAAWRCALERCDGPTALVLTRQKVPILAETSERAGAGVPRGGYILADPASGPPQLILIATGSEVSVALAAQAGLADQGIAARVVSLPSWELFDAQPESYRHSVLPPTVGIRLAIEAASPLGWERYVGAGGRILGVEEFGRSAPWQELAAAFGFTPERVLQEAKDLLETGR